MLLRWEQRDLAEASGISLASIKRMETQPGPLSAQERTLVELRRALERGGVDHSGETEGASELGLRSAPGRNSGRARL